MVCYKKKIVMDYWFDRISLYRKW